MTSQDSGSAPAYFAVIPANVRYANELPHGAKLLFGEIAALCNKEGYCWATNNYFAELYGKSPDTIRRYIHALSESGFIEFDIKESEGNTREIRLTPGSPPPRKNAGSPPRKNATYNNTSGIEDSSSDKSEEDAAPILLSEKGKRYFRDFTEQLTRYGQKEPSARAALAKLKNTYGDEMVFTTYFDNAALLETKEGGAFEYFVGILKRLKADADEAAANRQTQKTKDEKFHDLVIEQANFYQQFARPSPVKHA